MTIFIIGLVLAAVVVAAYVTLGTRDFLRIRREVARAAEHGVGLAGENAGERGDASPTAGPGGQTVGFAWRALGGVVASVGLLFAAGHLWWAWYVLPALALGTGVAVSVAFIIDPTKDS